MIVLSSSRLVIDACTGIKWVLQEMNAEQARKLLGGGFEIHVPDLYFVETANVFWKRVVRQELTADEAMRLRRTLST